MLSPSPSTNELVLGTTRLRTLPQHGFGLVITGPVSSSAGPGYLRDVLRSERGRADFLALIDHEGLVVCRNLDIDSTPYRPVGGKRTQGRMSQGEYFHHDGCSTPTRPRIVEIRCPPQQYVRTMRTATARFPDVVSAMLLELPASLRRQEKLGSWRDAVDANEPIDEDWEHVQGSINRTIRQLKAESARAYFRDVDLRAGAWVEPWELGESRFMANENAEHTVQHRRACHPPYVPGIPNGGLIKRWPGEELEPTTTP